MGASICLTRLAIEFVRGFFPSERNHNQCRFSMRFCPGFDKDSRTDSGPGLRHQVATECNERQHVQDRCRHGVCPDPTRK